MQLRIPLLRGSAGGLEGHSAACTYRIRLGLTPYTPVLTFALALREDALESVRILFPRRAQPQRTKFSWGGHNKELLDEILGAPQTGSCV